MRNRIATSHFRLVGRLDIGLRKGEYDGKQSITAFITIQGKDGTALVPVTFTDKTAMKRIEYAAPFGSLILVDGHIETKILVAKGITNTIRPYFIGESVDVIRKYEKVVLKTSSKEYSEMLADFHPER